MGGTKKSSRAFASVTRRPRRLPPQSKWHAGPLQLENMSENWEELEDGLFATKTVLYDGYKLDVPDTDDSNSDALGRGLAAMTIIPWIFCAMFYCIMLRYYHVDKAVAARTHPSRSKVPALADQIDVDIDGGGEGHGEHAGVELQQVDVELGDGAA